MYTCGHIHDKTFLKGKKISFQSNKYQKEEVFFRAYFFTFCMPSVESLKDLACFTMKNQKL